MSLYALLTKDKKVVWDTLGKTKGECWGNSFHFVAQEHGEEWAIKYWKRWDASWRSAKQLGYKIVKVKLVLAR